jgi:hypothetical protein
MLPSPLTSTFKKKQWKVHLMCKATTVTHSAQHTHGYDDGYRVLRGVYCWQLLQPALRLQQPQQHETTPC